MRFIHSFSTRPLGIQMYNKDCISRILYNIVYYALSVSYIKNLGHDIVLHTDSLGERLFGFLPYNDIYLTCDDIPNNVSPRFWASAKMWSLGEEDINSIHIDGDVFIKKTSLIDDLMTSDYDVVVQNFEHGNWYKGSAEILWRDKDYCESKSLILDNIGAYNTGILGFKNQELKDKFISGYKDLVTYYSDKYKDELETLENITPDIVLEQQYIYQLSKDYKRKILLDSKLNRTQFSNQANQIGYQHVLTSESKLKYVNKAMGVLKYKNEDIYKKTKKICQILLNK